MGRRKQPQPTKVRESTGEVPRNTASSSRARSSGRRRFRSTAALLVVLAFLAAGWWYVGRHARLHARAEALLESDPAAAAALLEREVSLDPPDDPIALVLLSRALLRTGRIDEALGSFSLIPNPRFIPPEDLIVLADDAASSAPLLSVLALEAVPWGSPAAPDALERLIELQRRHENWPRVQQLAEELIAFAPDRAAGWVAAAQSYDRLMDPVAAGEAWRRALELETDQPRRAMILRAYRRIMITLGEREPARAAHDELEQIDKLQQEDRIDEARLLRLEGRIEEARAALAGLGADDALAPDAMEVRGFLALDEGNFESAAADFQSVLTSRRENKAAHYGLAQALQRLGRTDEAAEHFAENRRLTALSTLVVDLQAEQRTGDAERVRLEELAAAYDELGMFQQAHAVRDRLRELPASHNAD